MPRKWPWVRIMLRAIQGERQRAKVASKETMGAKARGGRGWAVRRRMNARAPRSSKNIAGYKRATGLRSVAAAVTRPKKIPFFMVGWREKLRPVRAMRRMKRLIV